MYDYNEYYDEEIYEKTPLDELFVEYREKCKTILLASVQGEIEQIKKENENLKDSNEKLREQNNNIGIERNKFERDKEKFKKDYIAEYQRQQLSGLRCGDKIWTIKTEAIKEKCKHCNGTHKIKVDIAGVNKNVDCPHCNYSGEIIADKVFYPKERVIIQITTSMWNDNKTFKRHIYCKEERGSRDTYSDEFICDDEYGTERDAKETNQYVEVVERDFWITEQDCLNECKNRKEDWKKEKNKKK